MSPKEAAPDHAGLSSRIVVDFRSAKTWAVLLGWALFTALFAMLSFVIAFIMAPYFIAIGGPFAQKAIASILTLFIMLPLFLLAMFLLLKQNFSGGIHIGLFVECPGGTATFLLWTSCHYTLFLGLLVLWKSTVGWQDFFGLSNLFPMVFLLSGMQLLPNILEKFLVFNPDRGSGVEP